MLVERKENMHVDMFITTEFINKKRITIYLYNKNILN